MGRAIRMHAATLESLELWIATDADPTGTPPQFALSTLSAVAPGSFAAGEWAEDYGATTSGKTTARTPLIGGTGGTLTITSGSDYAVWCKTTLGDEVNVVKLDDYIHCP